MTTDLQRAGESRAQISFQTKLPYCPDAEWLATFKGRSVGLHEELGKYSLTRKEICVFRRDQSAASPSVHALPWPRATHQTCPSSQQHGMLVHLGVSRSSKRHSGHLQITDQHLDTAGDLLQALPATEQVLFRLEYTWLQVQLMRCAALCTFHWTCHCELFH